MTHKGRIPELSKEVKKQTIEIFERLKNKEKCAKELDIPVSTFKSRLKKALADDLDYLVPDGQKLRKTSILYNQKGEEVMKWIKTNADLDRQLAIVKEAVAAANKELIPAKPVKKPNGTNNDLCSVYVVTDYHIGQMSYGQESGEDWNTEKSVRFLVDWFEASIDAAPDSKQAILYQGGDFLHFDSIMPVTPTSGHILDTDARYSLIVNVAIQALCNIIDKLLRKHEKVHIIMAEGNHDISSSIWLRALFSEKFKNEKRITVETASAPYYAFEWGLTSLFFHHGHKRKLSEISKVFASLFREIFGRTKYSYAHMGHYHHVDVKEDNLMIVEQHPSLAPADAHSARGGYSSNRGANVISYHRNYGEVSRYTVRPEMIKNK